MMRNRRRLVGTLSMLSLMLLMAGCTKSTSTPQDRAIGPESMRETPDQNTGTASDGPRGNLEERDRQGASGGTRSGAITREDFMSQDVRFAYNSFTLDEDAKLLLEQKATWLAANSGISAQIEGHCDERGTLAYNLALGERRANAVKQYMVALGVSPSRLTTISYGEEFPLDPNHTEEAWARNRRAHFAILNP